MPMFEYQCEKCEATFQELVQSAERADGVSCAACGSKKVVRLFSAFATGRGSAGGTPSRKESPWSGGGGAGGGGSCGSGCACH